MPCYSPISAYRGAVNPSGKRAIVFKRPSASFAKPIDLPCGNCIGCRLERSRQWALRCLYESEQHEKNVFLTLTYQDDKLPPGGTLVLEHFQDFMKRLRFRYGEGIRFFHCGEYGEKLGRPHYHALIFNLDFPDKVLHSENRGNKIYKSQALDEIWGHGYAWIGSVTFESAAYVARYVMKKITGEKAAEHYGGKKPEYITMSRRPGIGAGWWDKYKSDVYPSDFLVYKGKKMKPPKFFDGRLEKENPALLEKIKKDRVELAKTRSENNTLWRLRDREIYKKAQIQNSLIRPLEAE